MAAFTDLSNDEDFENHHYYARYLKAALYLMILSFVKGGPENNQLNPTSVPARISSIGLSGLFLHDCAHILHSESSESRPAACFKGGQKQ